MIYIRINEKNEVTYTHFLPLHEEHGLGQTREELEKEGIFVDSIPTIECPPNKMAIEKYNHETNEIYYELVDRNPNYIEDKISILEEENADLLLDSATKDAKLSALEKDLADLTVEVIKGGM